MNLAFPAGSSAPAGAPDGATPSQAVPDGPLGPVRGRPLGLPTLAVLACLCCSAAMSAAAWLMLDFAERPAPGRQRDAPVVLEQVPGSLQELAHALHDARLITNPDAWRIYMEWMNAGTRLRPAPLVIPHGHSPKDLRRHLLKGFGMVTTRLTFPEGSRSFEIARKLERWGVTPARSFMAATRDPALLRELGLPASGAEGYLFPDTYELARPSPASLVVRRMVQNFRRRIEALHVETQPRMLKHGWGVRELVNLASIVQREARLNSELPIIAGVFYNRLFDLEFAPRRLQADPTAAYGCLVPSAGLPSCAQSDGTRVTAAMLRDPRNLYNTYRHSGLPPGPIANPGLEAMRATLEPGKHAYLYFVADGKGGHIFNERYGQHLQAVGVPDPGPAER